MLAARRSAFQAASKHRTIAASAFLGAATRRTYASSSSSSGKDLLSDQQASSLDSKGWKGTTANGGDTKLFIGGEWKSSQAKEWMEVRDPSTQRVLTKVPQSTPSELTAAVDAAADAFPDWSRTSMISRQGILLRYQALIREHMDDVAQSIVLEQGKTFADAKGDVLRGLQVVDSMCALPSTMLGSHAEVSKDMDTYYRRKPLGVGAILCPFNFPAMIPLWSIPIALGTGNTVLLKPSERDPGASAILVELAARAGFPKGTLNVVHGSVDTVNFICDEPRIKAISFVGGNAAGEHIFTRGSKNGKRVQANLGAKNHAILCDDASKESALNAIAGAAFGAAGQRCMALSVLVCVGSAKEWMPELISRAKALKVSNGFTPDADLGPVISPAAKTKIEDLIGSCEEEGGKILLDGRGFKVSDYPKGNFVGPTVLQAKEGMKCHSIEIFGPVLTVLEVETLDEAIALVNRNLYGNGASIFTNSGARARFFESNIEAGQIGINVPIPVPLPHFAWSGSKSSVLGGFSLYGPRGVDFWTQNATITAHWRADDAAHSKADVAMPVHH